MQMDQGLLITKTKTKQKKEGGIIKLLSVMMIMIVIIRNNNNNDNVTETLNYIVTKSLFTGSHIVFSSIMFESV